MRIERAIDAFLDWRRLERDAPRTSVESYRRILMKLAEDFPEVELRVLTTADLRRFLSEWALKSYKDRGVELSASTRSNLISVLHSFFSWAEAEELIEVDPSRKIRRPPKRKPDIYRPSLDELRRIREAAVAWERPAILLMEGSGVRRWCLAVGLTSISSADVFGYIGRDGTGIGCRWIPTFSQSCVPRSSSLRPT
jgi:site-specific recombinase XerD